MIRNLVTLTFTLTLASALQAQFNASWTNYNYVTEEYNQLTSSCVGGAPMDDNTIVKIYWDANANGPDAADQQPVVGEGFSQCNINTFPLNGAEIGIPGTFFNLSLFTIATNTPQPSLYYLVIEGNGIRWTSDAVTIPDGYSEFILETPEEWSCEVLSSIRPSEVSLVTECALHQNFPNPFNPSTDLMFDLVDESVVNLTVYNAIGQEVVTLVNSSLSAGRHSVIFDASSLTSGVYFYTVKIGDDFTATKKMLLVK